MLHFKSLRWKNFLSTGNVFTEIKLDRSPSTVIVGENGAGKSTILDALCYTLFNKPFRAINKPQLINSINGKDLLCEVEFSHGKNEYKIVRGAKPSKFEIYKNGKLLDQPGTIKDYQQQLEDTILKLNYKSFTQIVVLGNASFTPFMQLSGKDRREVIEDLLDIQIFSNMNTLLKDRVSQNKNEQLELSYQHELVENKIEVQKNYLKQLQDDLDGEIANLDTTINQHRSDREVYQTHYEDVNTKIDEYHEKIADEAKVSAKSSKASQLIHKLHDKTHKADKRLSFFNEHDHCPTCEQDISDEIKSAKIQKTNDIIAKTENAIAELEKEQKAIEDRLAEISKTQAIIDSLNNQAVSYLMEIQSIDKMIKQTIDKQRELEDKKTNDVDVSQVEELEAELQSLNDRREKLAEDKELYEIASHVLRDGGIKTKIIRQYVPVINKLVNKYLAAMDFFVNFELDEEFNEVIKSRHRDDFSYASFSEGEKARIDISLMLTWRAVAKLKNSVNTNLLILDEVFDSSMDANGVEILMGLFNELHDTNIFVISHKSDMMADKFRSMIRFEKIKSFSRIAP